MAEDGVVAPGVDDDDDEVVCVPAAVFVPAVPDAVVFAAPVLVAAAAPEVVVAVVDELAGSPGISTTYVPLLDSAGLPKTLMLAQLASFPPVLSAAHRSKAELLAQMLAPSGLVTPPPALVHDTNSCVMVPAMFLKKPSLGELLARQSRHPLMEVYQPSGFSMHTHCRTASPGLLRVWHRTMASIMGLQPHSSSLFGPSGAVLVLDQPLGEAADGATRRAASAAREAEEKCIFCLWSARSAAAAAVWRDGRRLLKMVGGNGDFYINSENGWPLISTDRGSKAAQVPHHHTYA